MKTGYVMFEEWLAERYPVLDEIVKSRRMRYAITPKLADEIKEYCKEAFAAGAASTPEAAGRMVEVAGCSRPHWGISDCSECGLRAEFQANSCAASTPKTTAVSEHQTENPRKPS